MPHMQAARKPQAPRARGLALRKGQRLPVDSHGNKKPLLLPSGPISIDRVELAWAAGFFDGEGSTFVLGKKKHPKISITQAPDPPDGTPPKVLDRFYRAVGGIGNVEGPYREKTGELKWFYTAHGHEMVQAVIALLWTWLGTVKREQATSALRCHREVPRGTRNPGVRFGRPLNAVCKRGHDYGDIVLNSSGNRMCRPCRNMLARERMRRVRLEWRAVRAGLAELFTRHPPTRRPRHLRAARCKRGHDPADSIVNSAGAFECRPCKNQRARERARKKKVPARMPQRSL